MNMITFTARSREEIVALHTDIADAVDAQDAPTVDATLVKLEAYTRLLAHSVVKSRENRAAEKEHKTA